MASHYLLMDKPVSAQTMLGSSEPGVPLSRAQWTLSHLAAFGLSGREAPGVDPHRMLGSFYTAYEGLEHREALHDLLVNVVPLRLAIACVLDDPPAELVQASYRVPILVGDRPGKARGLYYNGAYHRRASTRLDEGLKSEVLTSEAWGLKGKPDLLLRQGNAVIPVDQKPGNSRPKPYLSQVMQLAAYCALVEENYGVRPPHGIIRYAGDGVDVEVPYTPELEARLKHILERMRMAQESVDVHRSHDSIAKCRGCGFREICAESLA